MLYSSIYTSSMVFVRKSVTRLPFVPFQSYGNDAARFTLCYGLLFCPCFSQTYLASAQLVAQRHWKLATRLTGDCLDQIFTGKLITACRIHDFHPLENAHAGQTKSPGCLPFPAWLPGVSSVSASGYRNFPVPKSDTV